MSTRAGFTGTKDFSIGMVPLNVFLGDAFEMEAIHRLAGSADFFCSRRTQKRIQWSQVMVDISLFTHQILGIRKTFGQGGGFVSSHFFLVGGCFGGFCVQNIFLKFLAPLCSEKPNRVLSSSMSYLMLCRFVDSLKARKLNASAGNRTRVTSMATMYSTTRPPMRVLPSCMLRKKNFDF